MHALDAPRLSIRLIPRVGDVAGAEGFMMNDQNFTDQPPVVLLGVGCEQFKATMDRLSLTKGALARMFTELGDQAAPKTIRKRIQRWSKGDANVPGEVTAFLEVMERYPDVLAELRATVAVPFKPDDDEDAAEYPC